MFNFLAFVAVLIPSAIAVWELKKRKGEITRKEFWTLICLTIAATLISIYTLIHTNNETLQRDSKLAEGFQTIKEKDDSIRFLLRKNAKEITDSFKGLNSVPVMQATSSGELYFSNSGKDPAYDVMVSFYDVYDLLKRGKKKYDTTYTYSVGTIPPETSLNGPKVFLHKHTGAAFYCTFTSRKGSLMQLLILKHQNNKWRQAYQLTDFPSRRVYTFIASDYPSDDTDFFVNALRTRKPVEDLEVKIITEADMK